MEYHLDDSHPRYIRITVSGRMDKTGTIAAMSELIKHPDYHTKHSLWDFTQAAMGLSMADLGEIVGVLKLLNPRDKDFANRAALMVPGAMNQSMAKIYVSLSKLLPFDYRVCNTMEDALTFLVPGTKGKI